MSLVSIITHFPQILQSAIYTISTSLLYPVIIVLLGLTLWLITEIGVFTVEYLSRIGRLGRSTGTGVLSKKKSTDIEREIIEAKTLVDGGKFREGIDVLNNCTTSRFVYLFLDGLLAIKEKEIELDNPGTYKKLFPVNLEKLLQRCDLLISKRLEKSKSMIRLTKGDVETLAGSLIIAFGTTVVGLLIGSVAYLITTARTRWYRQDMNDVHYICEVLFGCEE
jgi:hypothetical protein